MTKRSKRSRKRGDRGPARKAKSSEVLVPSAATLFRFSVLDPATTGLMDTALSVLKPALWARDRDSVLQIRQAGTAAEVLDLWPLARGLGESEWNQRMRQFGPEVVPLISERLSTSKEIKDENLREMAVENLIGVLRRHGDAGASVLQDRFDDLNEYGQSLACVMWGLLGAETSVDRIWRFYREAMHIRRETYFVGALWGLIDLKDERAGLALVQLLQSKHFFYELFGFLSLAGDARAVLPLMAEISRRTDKRKGDPTMALVGVAHRIGREALLAELEKAAAPDDPRESIDTLADQILARSMESVQKYFALFYRGLTDWRMRGSHRLCARRSSPNPAATSRSRQSDLASSMALRRPSRSPSLSLSAAKRKRSRRYSSRYSRKGRLLPHSSVSSAAASARSLASNNRFSRRSVCGLSLGGLILWLPQIVHPDQVPVPDFVRL
jgi:hypothetical protein